MKPYTLFASVYDHIMKHVDYERWYSYLQSIMLQYTPNPKTILELGCGTGKFGAKFSRDNYQIFGMDNSINMLDVAVTRTYKNFRTFCADMRNFNLIKKFDFIFSVHDTLNYFLKEDDILNVLRSVKKIMHKDSIFFFDITTEYNIEKYFNNTTHYSVRDIEVAWENEYDPIKKLIYSVLTFKHDNLINTEKHVQRIYSIKEIKKLLTAEKFKVIDIFSDYTFEPVKDDTVMINFITKI